MGHQAIAEDHELLARLPLNACQKSPPPRREPSRPPSRGPAVSTGVAAGPWGPGRGYGRSLAGQDSADRGGWTDRSADGSVGEQALEAESIDALGLFSDERLGSGRGSSRPRQSLETGQADGGHVATPSRRGGRCHRPTV